MLENIGKNKQRWSWKWGEMLKLKVSVYKERCFRRGESQQSDSTFLRFCAKKPRKEKNYRLRHIYPAIIMIEMRHRIKFWITIFAGINFRGKLKFAELIFANTGFGHFTGINFREFGPLCLIILSFVYLLTKFSTFYWNQFSRMAIFRFLCI